MRSTTTDNRFIIIYELIQSVTDDVIFNGGELKILKIYSTDINQNDKVDFHVNQFDTLVITDEENIKWFYHYINKQFKRVV